uniref:Phospholipase B-like n=1 Tax=Chromera velia CCMP2878 TaxID=1169474 RepID=A0A0G4FYT8_9ALVE|eukprot:Cvel_19455.t1-p1 / transcript=Cvel_19455.t1 / gene=Cvel_19455 / organism=Chromera_velia_CCMP2878 / gene_product=hypothetical protein / transcript_product=hypothetical protein / location=Cvel_scaffold1678:34414-40569(-) / protein_length=914 / sequence_SO=supercontig / SO=protein_coding / is_pseudo=false
MVAATRGRFPSLPLLLLLAVLGSFHLSPVCALPLSSVSREEAPGKAREGIPVESLLEEGKTTLLVSSSTWEGGREVGGVNASADAVVSGSSSPVPLSLSVLERSRRAWSGLPAVPLFDVSTNVDILKFNASKGVSMNFEKGLRKFRLDIGESPESAIAWGRFLKERRGETGWSDLFVKAERGADPVLQAYGSGYVEGFLSAAEIGKFLSAIAKRMARSSPGRRLFSCARELFRQQVEYLQREVKFDAGRLQESPEDVYWQHIRFAFAQLWGIADGHNRHLREHQEALKKGPPVKRPPGSEEEGGGGESTSASSGISLSSVTSPSSESQKSGRDGDSRTATYRDRSPRFEFEDWNSFLQMNTTKLSEASLGAGEGEGHLSSLFLDLSDALLLNAFDELEALVVAMESKELEGKRLAEAVVRLTTNELDLLAGHLSLDPLKGSTAVSAPSTPLRGKFRIFKRVEIPLRGPHVTSTAGTAMSFPSHPGCLSSADQFFVLNSGLVLLGVPHVPRLPLWESFQQTLEEDVSMGKAERGWCPNLPAFAQAVDLPSPSFLPSAFHVIACNRIARTAAHWVTCGPSQNGGGSKVTPRLRQSPKKKNSLKSVALNAHSVKVERKLAASVGRLTLVPASTPPLGLLRKGHWVAVDYKKFQAGRGVGVGTIFGSWWKRGREKGNKGGKEMKTPSADVGEMTGVLSRDLTSIFLADRALSLPLVLPSPKRPSSSPSSSVLKSGSAPSSTGVLWNIQGPLLKFSEGISPSQGGEEQEENGDTTWEEEGEGEALKSLAFVSSSSSEADRLLLGEGEGSEGGQEEESARETEFLEELRHALSVRVKAAASREQGGVTSGFGWRALDAKVVNACIFREMQAEVRSFVPLGDQEGEDGGENENAEGEADWCQMTNEKTLVGTAELKDDSRC